MSTYSKRLPPLSTITAFEASARLMSFTRAGEELSLSQGAVSRQVKTLEDRMKVSLFNRRHKEIQLTRAGAIFQQSVQQSLDAMRRAVAVIEKLDQETITVAATPSLASFWLMPAIMDFHTEHPNVDIRVVARNTQVDLWREPIDLAIQTGDGHWANVVSFKLFEEVLFPVCGAQYLENRSLDSIHDLQASDLIELDEDTSVYSTWDGWFELAGLRTGSMKKALTFSNYDLTYRAACSGKGIALAKSHLVPKEARGTNLVRPIDISLKTGMSEYVAYSACEELSASAQAFLSWLINYSKGSVWT
ncbi:LysR substrate-binding domain-containing protein [Caballeronia sp. 15715]|uniref:LysR substrate-binding domain-containing protein n=1 Tax=unclassified Caballeronia TaxID=2646786 RepID=UPI0039E43F72